MGSVPLQLFLTSTLTVTPDSASAAGRMACKPARSRFTALVIPQWWSTTFRSLWNAPANGTEALVKKDSMKALGGCTFRITYCTKKKIAMFYVLISSTLQH